MTDRIEKRLVKLQILVTDSELASIDDWRFVNRSDNRSSAVRELMAIGLEMTKTRAEEVQAVIARLRK